MTWKIPDFQRFLLNSKFSVFWVGKLCGIDFKWSWDFLLDSSASTSNFWIFMRHFCWLILDTELLLYSHIIFSYAFILQIGLGRNRYFRGWFGCIWVTVVWFRGFLVKPWRQRVYCFKILSPVWSRQETILITDSFHLRRRAYRLNKFENKNPWN